MHSKEKVGCKLTFQPELRFNVNIFFDQALALLIFIFGNFSTSTTPHNWKHKSNRECVSRALRGMASPAKTLELPNDIMYIPLKMVTASILDTLSIFWY